MIYRTLVKNVRTTCMNTVNVGMKTIEPRHQKTCLRGLRPGKAKTGLLKNRDLLKS